MESTSEPHLPHISASAEQTAHGAADCSTHSSDLGTHAAHASSHATHSHHACHHGI
jgi:hypothetical protein